MSQNPAVRVVSWFHWLVTNRMSSSDQAALSERCDAARKRMEEVHSPDFNESEMRELSTAEYEETLDGLCGLINRLDTMTIVALVGAFAAMTVVSAWISFLVFLVASFVAIRGRANMYSAYPMNLVGHIDVQKYLLQFAGGQSKLESRIIEQYEIARLENDMLSVLMQRRISLVTWLLFVGVIALVYR